jgi:ABC-type nitrate/sulfonate/bicarbonate transport system substrate-binding protein
VTETYEIWLGPNRIAVWKAGSPLLALVEYLRAEGVGDQDIVRLGPHEVSWRGATYRAVATEPDRVLEPAHRSD